LKFRKLGLQDKWLYVVNSLENIVPSYERGSSRISLFMDRTMRNETVDFAVKRGELVLDLGSGPGVMARLIERRGGVPILLDVSMRMLNASEHQHRVRGAFENLPFRRGSFTAAVSGFAIRDSRDLVGALSEVRRTLKPGGRLAFCDLGKPGNPLGLVMIALYIRVFAPLIGLFSAGLNGLKFGSLFQTYVLTLNNDDLVGLLRSFFPDVRLHARQFGGSIVVKCTAANRN
jgi:demethylmenaquinone methyltransferase/2-methoxy-6-polyprenyl-1,4-benzoquinol methylase